MFDPPNAWEGFGNRCPGQSSVSLRLPGGGGCCWPRLFQQGPGGICREAATCLLVSAIGVGASQVMAGGSGPVQVKDSPLLLQQIEAMQLSIKHLKNENNRLKVSGSR